MNPNFIKDIKKYTVKIDNQNETKDNIVKYDLIYQIDEYEKISNKSDQYIKNLKRSGHKLRHYRKMVNGKVEVTYYKLYSSYIKRNNYIDNRVNQILKKVNGVGTTNEKYLNEMVLKDIPKNKKTPTSNKYQTILDILGTYLCRKSGSDVYVDFSLDKKSLLDKKEHDLEEEFRNKQLKRSLRRNEGKNFNNWKKRNKRQYNAWKQTKTRRLKKELNHPKFNNYWESMGLIDPNAIHGWCVVDTLNNFSFDNKVFHINNNLEQYKVSDDNEATMDKILAFYMQNNDKYYFYDENIKDISKKVDEL